MVWRPAAPWNRDLKELWAWADQSATVEQILKARPGRSGAVHPPRCAGTRRSDRPATLEGAESPALPAKAILSGAARPRRPRAAAAFDRQWAGRDCLPGRHTHDGTGSDRATARHADHAGPHPRRPALDEAAALARLAQGPAWPVGLRRCRRACVCQRRSTPLDPPPGRGPASIQHPRFDGPARRRGAAAHGLSHPRAADSSGLDSVVRI